MRERMAEEHWAIVNRYVAELIDILAKDAADGSEVTKVSILISASQNTMDRNSLSDYCYVLFGDPVGTRRHSQRRWKESIRESWLPERHQIPSSVSKVDYNDYDLNTTTMRLAF